LIIHSSDRHYLAQCRSLLYLQQQELQSAWIPPADAIMEKHSSIQKGKRYYYFRLKSRSRSFPNGKLTMHLGTAQSECYLDAVRAVERRDLLRINERRLIRIEAILDGMSEWVEDGAVTNVISMKDWVPISVRDCYLTQDEVDTYNEEYRHSQLESSNIPTSLDNQALLVGEAATKLESLDRASLEKWLHRIPAELLVELVEKSKH